MKTIDTINPAREDIWSVISDLFLDAKLLESDIQYIASELAASPFSLSALNYIYEYEVAPVLHGNLKQAAGIWGSFSHEEIIPKIHRQAESIKGKHSLTIPLVEEIKRAYILGETMAEWKDVLERVEQLRSPNGLQ